MASNAVKTNVHMHVGYDIGIINEYETRAKTVEVFRKGGTMYNVTS